MPEYLAPGVYVEEVDTGPKPIEGVSTSTSGMVGVTERGPENIPTLVVGYGDFLRQFGGTLDDAAFVDTWYLPHAAKGFFDNGGKRLYVVRVLPGAATFAAAQLYDRGETVTFQTDLASRAEEGEAWVLVADPTGISEGDSFLISDEGSSEYREVRGNILAAGGGIGGAQASGTDAAGYVFDGTNRQLNGAAAAGVSTITLDDVTGMTAAGGDVLQIGSAPNFEFVVTTLITGQDVDLASPIVAGYADTTDVSVIDTANPLGSTDLLIDASAGDTLLVIDDPLQIQGANVIAFGASTTEFNPLLDDAGVVSVRTAIGGNHNSGTAIAIPTLVSGTSPVLTEDASEGAEQLELDDRTALVSGSILQLVDGVDEEYVIVEDLIPPTAAGTNPGIVSLTSALRADHAVGTTAVTVMTDSGVDSDATTLLRDGNPTEQALVLGDASSYVAGAVLRIQDAGSARAEYHQLDANVGAADAPALLAINAALGSGHAFGLDIEGRSELLQLEAIDRGAWGNSLRAYAEDESDQPLVDTTVASAATAGDPTLRLASVISVESGSILEFYDAGSGVVLFQQKADGVLSGNRVQFLAGLDQDVAADTGVRTREFLLTIESVRINKFTLKQEVVPGMNETHRHLSMDPRHSRYVVKVVGRIQDGTIQVRADGRTDGESDLVRSADSLSEAQAEAATRFGPDMILETLPDGRIDLVPASFTGGGDDAGSISNTTYIGTPSIDPLSRTGLQALRNIEDVSIVSIPGRTSQTLQQALITHCELMRYRFAVLDPSDDLSMAEIQAHRGLYDSKYAAIYYPWLKIEDPFPENPRITSYVSIPPSGHMMGIYARSDIERGVHKAPANEVIRGISDLEVSLMKEHQDILNPKNINVLRNFRPNNRGLRVWGARVITSDPSWKYVNVRRLFIFIEHSIDKGTQWVVFEPNAEPLWERVRRVVSSFLLTVWRDGALMGLTPEAAFFVKCDRTTMTQDDIDNGKLIVQVGIAPVKPAEFVIFRIGQKAGGSELDEG